MQDKHKELFQSRFEKLRKENNDLKERIASQKKENADIRKSLARDETLLNAIPVGLILIQDGKVIRVNDTVMESLGYKSEDIIGVGLYDLIHIDERDRTTNIYKLWESDRMSPDRYDTRFMTSSGIPVFYEIRSRRIRFQNRTAFLLIATDIKERLENEQERLRSEKIDALMTMAAGIRDNLCPYNDVILDAVREYLSMDHPKDKRLEEIFKKLEEAAIKALDANEKLKIIVGDQRGGETLINFSLNDSVKAAVQSAERAPGERTRNIDSNTSLKTYLRSSSLIQGDLKDITNAISHIISNALEAMRDGGDIYITTEDNNGDAHVYIQDNGKGIPDNIKTRIFDPFFTTKKGAMGLGLSISFSIIKRYGGYIEFTSRDDEGAVFHVSFPISGEKPASKAKVSRKKITGAQIMIVQENDVAREVLSHLLKVKGCRITKASKATECLVKLKGKPLDLAIIDEDAVNMNWGTFIQKARKIIPGISIAMITGAKRKAGIDRHVGHGQVFIIKKPVDVNSALKQITEVLTAGK